MPFLLCRRAPQARGERVTLRQSFAWWSFTYGREVEPQRFLHEAADAGATGVEMLPAELWPAAHDAGLAIVTLGGHDPLEIGFNDPANHCALAEQVRETITTAAAEGIEAVIVFSGNRVWADDEAAIDACATGLAGLAEEASAAGVTLVLELLNSKVDRDPTRSSPTTAQPCGSTNMRRALTSITWTTTLRRWPILACGSGATACRGG